MTAYVGLGANLGDVAQTFAWAASQMALLPGVTGVRMSSLWRSAPVGPVADQPWFMNACAELRGVIDPRELMRALLALEREAGRDRSRETPQGPRTLDLDLLLLDDLVLCDPLVTLPHPRLAARAFALAPLVELAPLLVIPGSGFAHDLLAHALATQRVTKLV